MSEREESAVTQAPGEKSHELPIQPDVAAEPKGRITPALWMPAAPAIAWLAFSSAETDWNDKFYFGASIWYAADPDRIIAWLQEIEEHGDLLEDVQPEHFQRLLYRVIDGVLKTESYKAAKAEYAIAEATGRSTLPFLVTDDQIREAACTLRTPLERQKADAERAHATIWEGSERLRRALARGDLTACGWPGPIPHYTEVMTMPLRETIPRDVFCRPVTVTQDGVFAFARGDETFGDGPDTLWSGLLFDSADLVALHKPPEDDHPSKPYTKPAEPDTEPEKQSRKGSGGRPDAYDWKPFNQELIRYLVLDAQDPDLAGVRSYMKAWADANMGTDPPSDSSIERRIDQLVVRDIYVR
jgi:hypothetical protein